MTPAEQIEKIADILSYEFGGLVKFTDALVIKTSPHNEIARLFGAAVNLYDPREIWLLDSNGDWYRLKETDRNFEYVAASVIQRLKYLKMFVNAKVS